MALTLLYREMFEPAGADFDASTDLRDSGNPGDLGTVSGTIYCRPYGPKLVGESGNGWMGQYRDKSHHSYWSITSEYRFLLRMWRYFDPNKINWGASGSVAEFAGVYATASARSRLQSTEGGNFALYETNGGTTDTGYAIPTKQEFELSWYRYDVFSPSWKVHHHIRIRFPGDSSWTVVWDGQTTQNNGSYNRLLISCGRQTGGGVGGISLIGGIRLWAAGTSDGEYTPADAEYIDTEVADPPVTKRRFYLSATGSDNNEGSESRPWATIAKATDEMSYLGLRSKSFDTTDVDAAASAYDTARDSRTDDLSALRQAYIDELKALWDDNTGDVLDIDGDGLDTAGSYLNVQTEGLEIDLGGTTVDCRKTLSSGSWSAAGGYSNIWQYTLTGGSGVGAVLWRNDTWIAKLNLNDYANEAALLTALDGVGSTPTFYVNAAGDTLYYAGSNPTSDGATYQRSYRRDSNGVSFIAVRAPNVRVRNGTIVGTCRARNTDGDPGVDYAIQHGETFLTGHQLCEEITSNKASKHAFGLVSNANACRLMFLNCVAGPGTPYSTSYTSYVDYRGGGSGTTKTHYFGCSCTAILGTVGSTGGGTTGQAYYTHSGGQAIRNDFWDCDFLDGNMGGEAILSGISTVHDVECGYLYFLGSAGVDMRRCRTTLRAAGTAGGNFLAVNSIFKITDSITAFGYHSAAGSHEYYGCTFDLTNATHNSRGILLDIGTLTLTGKGNVLIFGGGVNGWAHTSTTSDTFDFDYNVYQGSAANIKPLVSYNDGSTTADRSFQYNSLDADSALVADAGLDGTTYVPSPGAVVARFIPAGEVAELDGTLDYLGELRDGDLTAGAIQFVTIGTPSYIGGGYGTFYGQE